jgi:hypothetical protein
MLICTVFCNKSQITSVLRLPHYLHRDPASRKRQRKGKSRFRDSKIWFRVPRDSDPRKTALARVSSTYKRQTRPLVREGAPQKQDCNCQTVINIWSWAPDGARYQDLLTDRPSVAMWLWLWLWLCTVFCNKSQITSLFVNTYISMWYPTGFRVTIFSETRVKKMQDHCHPSISCCVYSSLLPYSSPFLSGKLMHKHLWLVLWWSVPTVIHLVVLGT